MGCPVKKVVRTGSGAALMRDPLRAAAAVGAMRRATDLPLTVKIRSGWRRREINAIEIGRIAWECGADAVILHSRTADQGFGGSADWGLIAALRERLAIPVVGSGDVRTPEDAVRMLRETGCDAVMVGRGALGNPWIFRNVLGRLNGDETEPPSLAEREETILRHLALAIGFYGEKAGTRDFRKHLLWYTKGLRGGARFRQAAGTINDRDSVLRALGDYFRTLAEPAGGDPEVGEEGRPDRK
jgi:nifR3 family TIM-barrel protein